MDRREGHAGENAAAENTGGSYCVQCNKEFVQLEMHNLIIHQSVPERRCTICGMLFRSPNRLCSHLVGHSSSSERRCFECSQEFAETLDLLVHLDEHRSEHIYSCLTCGLGFASRFRLLDHTETSCSDNACCASAAPPPPPHTSLSETESEGYNTADSRKERLTVVIGANGFWHHMEAKRMRADRTAKENDRNNINRTCPTPEKKEEEGEGETSVELRRAESAGKDSGTEEMKEENIKTEDDEVSVKLEENGRVQLELEESKPGVVGKQASGFRKLKNTVKRKRNATTPRFRCRFCKKDLSNRKTLKYHELKHTGDLKYKCAKCNLRFPALYKLKEHSERHKPDFTKNLKSTQKKPVDNEQQIQYRCSHCNRWWSRKHQVAAHLSVDSSCCGQDFGCLTAKSKHVQSVHPGQKVFKCPKCPAVAYTTSAQLKRHDAILHKSTLKSFTCPVCSHRTTSMHNLRRHQRRNGCTNPLHRLIQQTPLKN